MIAKLITWAPDREAAIDAQIAALDSFVIDGISDNIDFLSALMQHPRFRNGDLATDFIADEYPDGFDGAPGRRAADRGPRRARRHGRRRSPTPARPRSTASWATPIHAAVASAWSGSRGERAPGADQALRGRHARGDRRRRAGRHRRPLGAGAAAAVGERRRAPAHRPGPPRRPRLGAADARRARHRVQVLAAARRRAVAST